MSIPKDKLFRGIFQKVDGDFAFWPSNECPMYTPNDLRKIADELDRRNHAVEQPKEFIEICGPNLPKELFKNGWKNDWIPEED